MNRQIEDKPKSKLLLGKEVLELMQISRTKLNSMVKAGLIPAPVNVGLRSVRWKREEIDSYIQNLGSGGAV